MRKDSQKGMLLIGRGPCVKIDHAVSKKTGWEFFYRILHLTMEWNLSNPTFQGTREMCQIVQNIGILVFYFS